MVGQRVDDDGGVLAGLDDLVQVADRPGAHGSREWAVHPDGLVAGQQVAPDEVGGRQVLVARHRDEGRPVAVAQLVAEAPRHVLDEPRLAAAGRPLEQHGQASGERRGEHLDLVADRQVPRGVAGRAWFHGGDHRRHRRRGATRLEPHRRVAGGTPPS